MAQIFRTGLRASAALAAILLAGCPTDTGPAVRVLDIHITAENDSLLTYDRLVIKAYSKDSSFVQDLFDGRPVDPEKLVGLRLDARIGGEFIVNILGYEGGSLRYKREITVVDKQATQYRDLPVSDSIQVGPIPVITAPEGLSIAEGDSLRFKVVIQNALEGGELSLRNAPPGGSLDESGNFAWRPDFTQGRAEAYQAVFAYGTVGIQIEKSIAIRVIDVNRPPRIGPLANQSISVNGILDFRVEASDPDNDSLVVTALPLPQGARMSGRNFTWKPAPGQSGTYPVRFSVSDGKETEWVEIVITVGDSGPGDLPWSEILKSVERTVYSIGLIKDDRLLGLGTGFAVDDSTIMTSAQVVNGLIRSLTDFGDSTVMPAAVVNGGSTAGQGAFSLKGYAIHPDYDSSASETFDFGLVTTKSKLLNISRFESDSALKLLASGHGCASLGFSGDLNPLNTKNPTATFKSGTLAAVRAFHGQPTTSENAHFILHDLNLSGGTSGSPIFNTKGRVIAIGNAGPQALAYHNRTDEWERIALAGPDYGIRIDQGKKTFQTPTQLFSDLKPRLVTYEFINSSLTDLQILFVNANLLDTIAFGDTLSFWDFAGVQMDEPVVLRTMVATENQLYWTDTLVTGRDFRRSYVVTNEYFLLQVANSTNKVVESAVVSSREVYDSSDLHLDIGDFLDVGYYKVSEATTFRLYFYNATQLIQWEDYKTTTATPDAKIIPLRADLVLAKPGPAIGRPRVGRRLSYHLSEYLANERSL